MIRSRWCIFALLPLAVLAGREKTLGVAPDLVTRYTPLSSGTWKCLDGSKEISWESVNDDYCDCADGSDEPGTSACANNTFYCRNEGHVGASIPSSRVNDGLCEPECCDGSDERPGLCGNRCKQIGETYRKAREEERKIRKTGSKIRSTYIAFAHKEKKRLEELVSGLTQEIALREKEVARLKDVAERAESISAAALQYKQESPLYKSLITHSLALKSLQREHKKHLEREKALGDILDALRSGYNPNYQDMAVLEAVRGWEFHAGLTKPEENEEGTDNGTAAEVAESELEEEMWDAEQLDKDLDKLLKSDYVSLLLEHEEHIRSPATNSLLTNLSAYMPDFLIPWYQDVKSTVLSWMQTLDIVRNVVDHAADSTRARQAFNDGERSLKIAREEKETAEEDLKDLFSVHGFGAEGEWKKLDGMCLELDTGEYIYEACLFDEVRQKPKKGGTTFSLGKFHSWNLAAPAGSPEFYTKQVYNQGARCWNGPQRSVTIVLTCATQNALLTAVEMEKCEYQITGTSPALCLPLDAETSRDEL